MHQAIVCDTQNNVRTCAYFISLESLGCSLRVRIWEACFLRHFMLRMYRLQRERIYTYMYTLCEEVNDPWAANLVKFDFFPGLVAWKRLPVIGQESAMLPLPSKMLIEVPPSGAVGSSTSSCRDVGETISLEMYWKQVQSVHFMAVVLYDTVDVAGRGLEYHFRTFLVHFITSSGVGILDEG